MFRTILFLLVLTTCVHANEVQQGRYTMVDPTILPEQQFPLIEVKNLTIPETIYSNGQAVDFILTGTGYTQAEYVNRSAKDQYLMGRPLARVNRLFQQTSILEMLKAIAGAGYVPIVDPINRLVAFELDHAF